MFFAALSALSLASAAAAQNVVVVQVGSTGSAAALQFTPPTINAANGTVVSFQFTGVPGNHTVTQSSFSSPCNPLDGGFDSGWVQILSAASATPEFNITITDDSKPIWYYCKQIRPLTHCTGGMVGAINAPTSGNTFQAFQSAAKSFSGQPGQGVGNLVGVGASASAPVGPVASPVVTFGSPNTGAASASATAPASSSGSAATTTPTSAAASHGVAGSAIALLVAAFGFSMI